MNFEENRNTRAEKMIISIFAKQLVLRSGGAEKIVLI